MPLEIRINHKEEKKKITAKDAQLRDVFFITPTSKPEFFYMKTETSHDKELFLELNTGCYKRIHPYVNIMLVKARLDIVIPNNESEYYL